MFNPGFKFILILIMGMSSWMMTAQYEFSGYVDESKSDGTVYLSMVEDYRKISGVYQEQIIAKVRPDSTGFFYFSGNNLPESNRMYRIHVDTCPEDTIELTHTTGHCKNSEEIVFVANNSTTLNLPVTFENEMFCKVVSNDERSNTFLKIDSLKNDMRYAFSSYRSEANRKINTEKWFSILQQYGEQMNEPLAELYIYSFLSDRRSDLHSYYLKDLGENTYYDELLTRLKDQYPDTYYTRQYEAELNADRFLINASGQAEIAWWWYLIAAIAVVSLLANFYVYPKWYRFLRQRKNGSQSLSNQERKVLDLILDDRSNKEIAAEMFVSLSTVKTHINNLYRKLNVGSRDEVKLLYSRK